MSKRLYKKAPLPFIGQKKNFQKYFIEVLEKNIEGDGEGWTIVDVFGGSGLLAHTAKRTKPKAKVIYNDFDCYAERLKGIADTNRLREMLFEVVITRKKDTRLSEDERAKVIDIVELFSSDKSEIIEYLEYVTTEKIGNYQNFEGYKYKTIETTFNKDSTYKDNMVYRFK